MSPSNKLHIFSVLSVQSLVGASGGEGVIRKHVALFAVFYLLLVSAPVWVKCWQ